MPDIAPFAGFGPDALDFLDGLAADNSKAYFDANRTTYDEQVATPEASDAAGIVDFGRRGRVICGRVTHESPRSGREQGRSSLPLPSKR